MLYKVYNHQGTILEYFETYEEALHYVLKLGDESKLAKVKLVRKKGQ